MKSQLLMLALVVISIGAFFAFLWQLKNMRGVLSRGSQASRRRPSSQDHESSEDHSGPQTRRGDRPKLTSTEKRLKKQAEQFMAEGKIQPAAQILEQIGLAREAISALEEGGLIHEAASMLMRMQRHNRAGVVYARHAMWDHAAKCFKLANMPLEVAKCYREAGDFQQAGEYFEKAGRPEEAAACYAEARDYRRAARFYSTLGQTQKAADLLERFANEIKDIHTIQWDENELRWILNLWILGLMRHNSYADLIFARNKGVEAINGLLKAERTAQAALLLKRCPNDSIERLLAEANLENGTATTLARVLVLAERFKYAGMLFERLTLFQDAGQAFELCEMFERARYCYDRAGNRGKSKELVGKADSAQTKPHAEGPTFALSSLQGESDPQAILPPHAAAAPVHVPQIERPQVVAAAKEIPIREAAISPAPAMPLVSVHQPAPVAIALTPPVEESSQLQVGTINKPPTLVPPPSDPFPNEQKQRAAFEKAVFLNDLSAEEKHKFWGIAQKRSFKPFDSIVAMGSEPEGIFFITEGTVSCFRNGDQDQVFVDKVIEAESFGELWLLSGHPSTVRIVADTSVQLVVITRESFNSLLAKEPAISGKMYKRFTERLLAKLLQGQIPQQFQRAS